jgi:hypothetical protein
MIRLNVGFSRKVGEPDYGSRGASVNLDVELATGDLEDARQLRGRIRDLYDLARQAVAEELDTGSTRGQGGGHGARPRGDAAERTGRRGAENGNGGNGNGQGRSRGYRSSGRSPRGNGRGPAGMTASQRKAIEAIAHRLGVDPAVEIRDEFGRELDQLSLPEASEAIDFLKGLQAAGNGGGR